MTLRNIFPAVAVALAATASPAYSQNLPRATLTAGDSTLCYRATTPWSGEVAIELAPCMANELFTFSRVSVGGKPVNVTGSDNIGPFGLVGAGWSGGNHLNEGMRSARTESVEVLADGRPVDIVRPDTLQCGVLTVKVTNTLLMPADTVPFAIETMTYTVAGNSIDVQAAHCFLTPSPVKIDRYYGMQSMFIGETETLTPGGRYATWTPIGSVDRFDKASAPNFDTFVEHSPVCYQAAWLDPATGLGDRGMIDDSDWVFIGNSYSKAYHKTIGARTVRAGDTLRWHGVYTWFTEPVSDGARGSGPAHFAYAGYEAGRPVLFYSGSDGRTLLKPL